MPLPNFFVAGAPKCGTTSLVHYMNQHPEITFSSTKEPHFFNLHYGYGLDWYQKKFFAHVTNEKRIGDGSVWYMKSTETLTRIHSHIPDALFIYVLRDPVVRAYSMYNYNVMRGVWDPSITFGEVIRRQSKKDDILGAGRYYDHLVFFETLFDRSQVRVFLYEDLVKRQAEMLREIFEFLGVDPNFKPADTSRRNVTAVPRNPQVYRFVHRMTQPVKRALNATRMPWVQKLSSSARSAVREKFFRKGSPDPMPEEDLAFLREYYKEPNRQIAEYLGRDLSHWT